MMSNIPDLRRLFVALTDARSLLRDAQSGRDAVDIVMLVRTIASLEAQLIGATLMLTPLSAIDPFVLDC